MRWGSSLLLSPRLPATAELADWRRRRPPCACMRKLLGIFQFWILYGTTAYQLFALVSCFCSVFLVARRLIHSPFGSHLARRICENAVRMPAIGARELRAHPQGLHRSSPSVAGVGRRAALLQTTETVSLETLKLPALG